VLHGRREVYYLTGDIAASWGDAEALLPLARQLEDDPVWLIDALLQQPGVGFFRNKEDVFAGVSMAEQALALSRQLGDRRREMQCLGRLAGQRYFLNDPTWQELMEEALELARELGDKRTEVGILTAVGDIYAMSDPARSQEYLELALPIVKALDDKTAELALLDVIGEQLESSGDYFRRLMECHEKQLEISREIGHRPAEAKALMFYGQIQSLYLGDYEAGLALLEEAIRVGEGVLSEAYPLLRIAQIHVAQGRHGAAQAVVERARRHGEQQLADLGRAGLSLVTAIVYNALQEEAKLRSVLELTAQTFQMSAENPQLSQQYQMAAKCEAAAAHLRLAELLADEMERQRHLLKALECSQEALDIYESFGFVRPVECVSEEILFRHSLALAANGREAEADEYLRRAYDEMMRKHDLIPEESHYRHTFLENMPLHREICTRAASAV
jgi:tetratricopeptide (TPR) repeat protein